MKIPQDTRTKVADKIAQWMSDAFNEAKYYSLDDAIIPLAQLPIAEEQVKRMVDRFLGWTLPEYFTPDCGISFTYNGTRPTGTNLFDAVQAEEMVRYMLECRNSPPKCDPRVAVVADELRGPHNHSERQPEHTAIRILAALDGMKEK